MANQYWILTKDPEKTREILNQMGIWVRACSLVEGFSKISFEASEPQYEELMLQEGAF